MTLAEMTAILRAPFLAHGRSLDGWDCFGLVHCLAPKLYGFALPSFTGIYDGVDQSDGAQLQAAIESELGGFEEGPAGPDYPILTFVRWEFRSHVGLAIDGRYMLHADCPAGTLCERFDIKEWARPVRALKAFRPKGWRA